MADTVVDRAVSEDKVPAGALPGKTMCAQPALMPSTRKERYRFLDLFRGVALLGILPANLPLFALPCTLESPHWVTDSGWREPFAFWFTNIFIDTKFITIFSLLFGVGLALIHQRCVESGRSFRSIYLRRIAVLLCFGLSHAIFLWYGDILCFYASFGFVAMWMANWSARTLKRVGMTLLAVPFVFMLAAACLFAFIQDIPEVREQLDAIELGMAAPMASEQDIMEMGFVERLEHFGPNLESVVYRDGSYAEMVSLRVVTWAYVVVVIGLYYGWRILGLFLLGMALLKGGWFVRPEENPGRFRRWGIAGFSIGILLQVMAAIQGATKMGSWAGGALGEACQYVGSFGMSAAYVALVAWLYVRFGKSRVVERISAVGQAALSNYILQTIICTSIFYAYGLALFGSVDRLQLWAVMLAVWMLMLLISRPWLARFEFGPLEWLWRRLTYGLGLSMRRGRNVRIQS